MDRLIGGVYSGDLNPRNNNTKKYEKGMDFLTLATLEDATKILAPQINEQEIRTGDKSKESQEAYLQNIASLLEGPLLDSFLQQSQTLQKAINLWTAGDYTSASKILNDLSLKFTAAYTQLLALSVPPSWMNFHKNLLAMSLETSVNYQALKRAEEDPILAAIALNNLSNNLPSIALSLTQELESLIQKNELGISETDLLEILKILNSEL